MFDDYPLQDLRGLIDWTPFFQTWELAGRYPAILDDEVVGTQARELFADANAMLDRIIAEKWLTAKAVAGLWPANSVGDDIHLQRRPGGGLLHCLRQQADKPDDRPNLCLADFVAPQGQRPAGLGGRVRRAPPASASSRTWRAFEKDNDDYSAILLKALADRFAEALRRAPAPDRAHAALGLCARRSLDNEALIREQYRGIRPAPGYPACPEHSEKATIFRLLDAEKHTGLSLTESFAMYPAAAVSGLYFSHPGSQYFVVGRLSREQVADYARRKGATLAQAERWLASNLDYDPE